MGVALAWAGIRLVAATAPTALPRVDEISIGPIVILFAGGLSVLAGILFGLIPVLKLEKPSLSSLNEGGRWGSEGGERHRAKNALVVSEIALALGLSGSLCEDCVELILNAANINFIAFSRQLGDLTGQVFAVFVITIAAAEAAIGLGIIVALVRLKQTVNLDQVNVMEG